jgi:hypothetical protein
VLRGGWGKKGMKKGKGKEEIYWLRVIWFWLVKCWKNSGRRGCLMVCEEVVGMGWMNNDVLRDTG